MLVNIIQTSNPIELKQVKISNIFILFLMNPNFFNPNQNKPKVDYPVRFTYINNISQWWPPQKIAAELGVPEYAEPHIYNYIALSFWSYLNGPLDIVLLWSDPVKYFGADSPFGRTKDEIQKFLKAKYNKYGIKLMISAFGATQFPTTSNVNPIDCAIKLGSFVKQNNLDGVDIDWQDNGAMEAGRGEEWLITFSQRLREILPNHIITHAPQAPYFCRQNYKNGAYMTIHNAIGNLIDFYNVQFYNQGNNSYDTYEKLFICSGPHFQGTSVSELAKRGVTLNKIVVGKPCLQKDVVNTGLMDMNSLKNAINRAYKEGGWSAGVMFWQFSSDKNGQAIMTVINELKQACGKI